MCSIHIFSHKTEGTVSHFSHEKEGFMLARCLTLRFRLALRRQTLHFCYRNCRRFIGFLKEICVRHIIGKQFPYPKQWFHARATGIFSTKTNEPTTISIGQTEVSCSVSQKMHHLCRRCRIKCLWACSWLAPPPDLMKGHLGAKELF